MKNERIARLWRFYRSLPGWVQVMPIELISLGIVLLIVGFIASGTSTPGTITSHGEVELTTTALSGQLPSDAFPDVAAGGQVTVIDSSGAVVGTATLTQGLYSTGGLLNADFLKFTVNVPANLTRYGIEVGQDRGTVWFSSAQMKNGPGLELDG